MKVHNETSDWTAERIAQLTELVNERQLSASQIAYDLGVTRNAVIGKARRLGLQMRSASYATVRAPRSPRAYGPRKAKAKPALSGPPMVKSEPVAVPAPPTVRGLSLMELTERTCKWPMGHPGTPEFNFCGNESGAGTPYCDFHHRLAYRAESQSARVEGAKFNRFRSVPVIGRAACRDAGTRGAA